MKFIKQKSTNKIVYRQDPWDESRVLSDASEIAGIDIDDLMIVDEDLTQEKYEATQFEQLDWKTKRIKSYPHLEDQLDMQYWDAVNGTFKWKDYIAKVKSDIPKE